MSQSALLNKDCATNQLIWTLALIHACHHDFKQPLWISATFDYRENPAPLVFTFFFITNISELNRPTCLLFVG